MGSNSLVTGEGCLKYLGLLVFQFLGTFVGLLPRTSRTFLARGLGNLIRVLGWKTKVVENNLRLCYPNDPSLRKQIFSESYYYFGCLLLEILTLVGSPRLFLRRIRKEVTLKGLENWENARDSGRGVIFLASHLGNWEIMAAAGAMNGIPSMIVTKRLKPAWLHDRFEKVRLRCGVEGTYEPKTLKDILKHLKKGGAIAIVLDQYAGDPIGVRVPFFGQNVGTSKAFEVIVKRTGAIVLPCMNFRTLTGHSVEIGPPLLEPRSTAEYVRILEAQIRQNPEQWLWVHRRFKGDLSFPTKSTESLSLASGRDSP